LANGSPNDWQRSGADRRYDAELVHGILAATSNGVREPEDLIQKGLLSIEMNRYTGGID
jgi:hypothetical protein